MPGEDLTIPVDELGNTTDPLALPLQQQESPFELEQFLTPSFSAEQQEQFQQLQEQTGASEQDLVSALFATESQGARTLQAEQQAGIPGLQTQLTDIMNQITQKDLAFRRQREELTKEAGLTAAQKQARLGDISRKQASELADLEVIRAARSNSLTNAQNIINRKTELMFADEKRRVDNLRFIYENNKEKLTKKEDRLYQEVLRKEERAFGVAMDRFETLENTKLSLVQTAKDNGAPNSVLQQIMGSDSVEGAFSASGSYGQSMQAKLNMLQIREARMEIDRMQAASQERIDPNMFPVGTPQNTIAWLRDSAQFDKTIDKGQREEVQQTIRALSGLETLNSFLFGAAEESNDFGLKQTYDGLKTGRVTGRAQNLMTQLKGNANVAGINATIQGMIPTVARGIFGEVGVLTDTDIANYRKVLPTVTNTQSENELVTLILMDVLEDSLETTLTTASKTGQNVSRFESTYLDVKQRIEEQKLGLGITPFSEKSDDAFLNEIPGFSTGTNSQSFFSSLMLQIN